MYIFCAPWINDSYPKCFTNEMSHRITIQWDFSICSFFSLNLHTNRGNLWPVIHRTRDGTILNNRISSGCKIGSLWCASWVKGRPVTLCLNVYLSRKEAATRSPTRTSRSVRTIMYWVINIFISGFKDYFFFRLNDNLWRWPTTGRFWDIHRYR